MTFVKDIYFNKGVGVYTNTKTLPPTKSCNQLEVKLRS